MDNKKSLAGNPRYALLKELPSKGRCFSTVAQAASIDLHTLARRRQPQSILMCDPRQFRVVDVKNAFMEGNINATSSTKAAQQWDALRHVFEKLGHHVEVVRSRPGREDMVFTANQVLLGADERGHKFVVPANMVHVSRQKEISYFEKWFATHGYRIVKIGCAGVSANSTTAHTAAKHAAPYFEGQGDALWHPGVQLLWGGWGHRSELAAYHELCRLLDVPVLTLHLVHPRFYHLDTAFCPLDIDTVMYYPKAFDIRGNELIRYFFKNVIAVNDDDAENFACNALALDKHVVLQEGSNRACAHLRRHGFKPVEADTSEFMKSGGSVSCLKMLIY